jgi:hypothetical protein|tara:strand:+ start:62 stop:412 length:351 start_codon:yes stop_codon:yes gene_type:complete
MPGKEIKGRSKIANYRHGGRTGFTKAGPVGNLPWVRGTSRPGVKKAPRGAQHKEAIKQEKRWETLDTKVKGKMILGPKVGKYPAIDKIMKNITKQKKKGIKNPGYDPDFKAKGGKV